MIHYKKDHIFKLPIPPVTLCLFLNSAAFWAELEIDR